MVSLVFNISSINVRVDESPCGSGSFVTTSFWRFELELGGSFSVGSVIG